MGAGMTVSERCSLAADETRLVLLELAFCDLQERVSEVARDIDDSATAAELLTGINAIDDAAADSVRSALAIVRNKLADMGDVGEKEMERELSSPEATGRAFVGIRAERPCDTEAEGV